MTVPFWIRATARGFGVYFVFWTGARRRPLLELFST